MSCKNSIVKNCDRLVDDINALARTLTYDKYNKNTNNNITKLIANSKMLNEYAIKFVISKKEKGNVENISEYLSYHIPPDYYSDYEKIAFSCRIILNYIKGEKNSLDVNESSGIGLLSSKIFVSK
mgnify:FL=1|jgi:hypothetical protein